MTEFLVLLSGYLALAIFAGIWVAGVKHYSENKRFPRLNNRPNYLFCIILSLPFILPAVISTIIVYGYKYQKPIKGVTYDKN